MRNLFFFLVLFPFFGIAQKNEKTDYKGLQKLEGIEYLGGITFYIEAENQNLIAIQNDTVKWKADVIKNCGKRKTNITSVNVRSKKLKVSFGKKNNALIDIEKGEIECLAEKNDEFDKTEINFINKNIIKK